MTVSRVAPRNSRGGQERFDYSFVVAITSLRLYRNESKVVALEHKFTFETVTDGPMFNVLRPTVQYQLVPLSGGKCSYSVI